MKSFAVSLAVLITTPALCAPAIWETYPVLLCRGETTYFCDVEGGRPCDTRSSTAVLTFNFVSGYYKSFVSKAPERIIARIHKVFPYVGSIDHNSVVLDYGESVTFFRSKPDRDGVPKIVAVKQGAMLGAADTMALTCHPS